MSPKKDDDGKVSGKVAEIARAPLLAGVEFGFLDDRSMKCHGCEHFVDVDGGRIAVALNRGVRARRDGAS